MGGGFIVMKREAPACKKKRTKLERYSVIEYNKLKWSVYEYCLKKEVLKVRIRLLFWVRIKKKEERKKKILKEKKKILIWVKIKKKKERKKKKNLKKEKLNLKLFKKER